MQMASLYSVGLEELGGFVWIFLGLCFIHFFSNPCEF